MKNSDNLQYVGIDLAPHQQRPRRKAGFLLWLGLLLAPAVFCWVALFGRYSIGTKLFALLSAGLQAAMIVTSLKYAPLLKESLNRAQSEIARFSQLGASMKGLSAPLSGMPEEGRAGIGVEGAAPIEPEPLRTDVAAHIAQYCQQKPEEDAAQGAPAAECRAREEAAYRTLTKSGAGSAHAPRWNQCVTNATHRSYARALACLSATAAEDK